MLYTTGEPCSMCMSALVWAGIGGVVFASSIDGIRRAGHRADQHRRQGRRRASPFYKGCCWAACSRPRPTGMFLDAQAAHDAGVGHHVSLMLPFWMMLPNILLSSVIRLRKSGAFR